MFCVIYRSVAASTIQQSDIIDLLERAKDYNRANDVTGCLLYYNYEFVQYLEGDRKIVMHLFEKIKRDSRHKDVQLLFSGHTYTREFEDWTMAYENFMDTNNRLERLKFIVSSYFDNRNVDKPLNPLTKKFWVVVKSFLASEPIEKFK